MQSRHALLKMEGSLSNIEAGITGGDPSLAKIEGGPRNFRAREIKVGWTSRDSAFSFLKERMIK